MVTGFRSVVLVVAAGFLLQPFAAYGSQPGGDYVN